MPKPLIISIAGISVSLSKFADDAYPRIDSDVDAGTEIKYWATGSISASRPIYERHYSFNVNCFCTPEQEEMLDLIWAWHDHQVADKQDADILVSDYTRPIRELLPRSRGVASGTEPIESYAGLGVAYVSYYATFYCWMDARPEFFFKGKNRAVSFVLHESGRTEP